MIIVGAGCVGGAVARALSRYALRVLVLEAADDVSQGATKGNSGIVHAGYDDTPGSKRAHYCWRGNQMFPQLDRELRFGFQRNGSLVLAFDAEEMKHLHELKERGEANGVQRLRVLGRDEVVRMEPYVNPDVMGALHSPDAGNVIPYEYAIALCENAADNGVDFRVRREVSAIQADGAQGFTVHARHWEPRAYVRHMEAPQVVSGAPVAAPVSTVKRDALLASGALGAAGAGLALAGDSLPLGVALLGSALLVCAWALFGVPQPAPPRPSAPRTAFDIPPVNRSASPLVSVAQMATGGSGSSAVNDGTTVSMEKYRARFVVNCAGCGADRVAAMVGDHSFTIKPRVGDYLLMHRNQGHLTHATLFPCPGPLGKGVLVQTTLWGNLILGPTARDADNPEHQWTPQQITDFIVSRCKRLVPSLDATEVIHSFAGARAKSTRGDWIVEPSTANAHFFNVAGIDSPGLAGSPAIAEDVVRMLADAGLALQPNPTYSPQRAPTIVPKAGWKGLKAGPPGSVPDPTAAVVCKCEKVTEAEVVTALHRSLPVDSTQAIRKRTRAGMGHCQGDPDNYNCECRVADLISRETGLAPELVGRRPWPATSLLPSRFHRKEAAAAAKGAEDAQAKAAKL